MSGVPSGDELALESFPLDVNLPDLQQRDESTVKGVQREDEVPMVRLRVDIPSHQSIPAPPAPSRPRTRTAIAPPGTLSAPYPQQG